MRNKIDERRHATVIVLSPLKEIIDEFQINEINVDLRTSGFDNEVLCVDACAVW